MHLQIPPWTAGDSLEVTLDVKCFQIFFVVVPMQLLEMFDENTQSKY